MRDLLKAAALIIFLSLVVYGVVLLLWPPEISAASLHFLWAGLLQYWPVLAVFVMVAAATVGLVAWWNQRK